MLKLQLQELKMFKTLLWMFCCRSLLHRM